MSDIAVAERLDDIRTRQARNAASNARFVAELRQVQGRGAGEPRRRGRSEHIDLAADLGATVAEFPVTRQAAERAHARGMTVVMGGPNLIRGGSYSGNVRPPSSPTRACSTPSPPTMCPGAWSSASSPSRPRRLAGPCPGRWPPSPRRSPPLWA